jgi:DNA-binding CsgD family transcriptional regulator
MIELALPPHRAPFDPAGGALRSSTVLVVAPGHAVWAPLTAGLLSSGVGRVLRAESLEAVEQILRREPAGDLALVCMSLRGKHDRVIRRLRAAGWRRVLPLTPDDSDPVRAALLADAHATLGASVDPESARHEYDLSRKQLGILQQVAAGRPVKKIGKDLGMSASGVKAQIGRIAEKLGSDDLVAAGLRAGLIS